MKHSIIIKYHDNVKSYYDQMNDANNSNECIKFGYENTCACYSKNHCKNKYCYDLLCCFTKIIIGHPTDNMNDIFWCDTFILPKIIKCSISLTPPKQNKITPYEYTFSCCQCRENLFVLNTIYEIKKYKKILNEHLKYHKYVYDIQKTVLVSQIKRCGNKSVLNGCDSYIIKNICGWI